MFVVTRCQASERWFDYVRVPDPVKKCETLQPRGSLCWICGTLTEAFPLFTVDDVKARLVHGVDMHFEAKWVLAKDRLLGKVPYTFKLQHVATTTMSGLKATWPYSFVENGVFLAANNGIEITAAGLALKPAHLIDPDGNKRHGALFRRGTLPDTLPQIDCELFTQTSTEHVEYSVHNRDSLHPKHGQYTYRWAVADEKNHRPLGLQLANSEAAPSYLEVAERALVLKADQERKEKERAAQLALADAAEAAAAQGDVEAYRMLERGAATVGVVGSNVSFSRLGRTAAESDEDVDAPTTAASSQLRGGGGGGGGGGAGSAKKRRAPTGSTAASTRGSVAGAPQKQAKKTSSKSMAEGKVHGCHDCRPVVE